MSGAILATSRYLIVGCKRGRELTGLRVTKTRPNTGPNEVAIRVELSLPASLFERPALTAGISVTEDQVGANEITAEVQNNIEELVREQLGIDLAISVPEATTGGQS